MRPHTTGEAKRHAGGSDARAGRRGDRGVSEVVAIALLVGMVVVGALLVAASGGQVIDDARDRSAAAGAAVTIQEFDARVSSLAPGGGSDRIRLAAGPDDPGRYRIDRSGSITVGIDGGTCSATVPLTSVRYSTPGGTTLTYEAGGVWRTDAGGTTAVAPPDLRYRNRTVEVSVANISGRIARSRVRATLLPSSRADTRAIERRLFASPECDRPDSVTITVRSDRYRAWGRYMADEFGLDVGREVRLDATNRTAMVTLPGEMLPPEADDDRNQVVDFDGGMGRQFAGAFSVNKSVPSQTYPVSITVLGGDTQGGRPTVSVHRDRQPLDVVLVIDESTSMSESVDGSGSTDQTKLEATQTAAVGFVDRLDPSAGDRVGVVGYSDAFCPSFLCPPGYAEDARVHASLSNDHGAAVESVNEDLRAWGSTPIAAGIDRTSELFADEGRAGREHVAVLLSDGRNRAPEDPIEAAERAAARNVTIYTVGFGDDADEETLEGIANATGGEYYYAENASELTERFEDIAVEVTRSRSIRSAPVTMRAGSVALLPNGSVLAAPPNGSAANLKDPDLSFPIAYSTELRDGRQLPFTLTSWECGEWAPTNETVPGPDGTPYVKDRCVEASAPNASVNDTSAPDRVRAFTATNTTADLPDGTGSWAESNATEIVRAAGLVGPDGNLSLASNQVLLLYDLPEGTAGDGDYNDEVVLVEVGYSTGEVRVRYAVSVGVRNVRLGTGS